jgi:hemin uptake protein HemP
MTNESRPADDAPAGPPGDDQPGGRDGPRVLRSEDLFAGQRAIVIEHAGAQYRLLITRNDRLILQK